MTIHDHLCRHCGGAWRRGCSCARGEDGDVVGGLCATCRDEAVLIGLFIGTDILCDGELDGDWDGDE